MNKKICKNCEYWGVEYPGACDFVNTIPVEKKETRFEVKCDANDDQGLYSMLMTGPEFGCIHFIKRLKRLDN